MTNKEAVERVHEMQEFCESFFIGEDGNLRDNADENAGEDE